VTLRHAAAALAAAAALTATGGAVVREARAWTPSPGSPGERTDRAVAALSGHLPPRLDAVGWRAGPEPDAAPFQLAQYALVPLPLTLDAGAEFVLVDAPKAFASELARAEGLVEVAEDEGFHLLRRPAP
jgi:hypothetical protein